MAGADARATRTAPAELLGEIRWRSGAVSGAAATVVMGLLITATDLATLQVAIAGLYGQEGNLLVGWLAHVLHGSLFGVVFAAVLTDAAVQEVPASPTKSVAAGAVYGTVLAVVGAGIVMPIWLAAAGVAGPEAIPHITAPSVGWHLVYGVVLGGAFSLLER